MHQQLQVVNEVVVDYKAKIDLDIIGQLEEQNDKLKKYLLDAIVERKIMRTSTLFAMAKARQFEAEFESIQKEWNRNQRMRNMMLTSWPEDEQMYPGWWDKCNWTLPSGSIDWKQVPGENHHRNMQQVHEYSVRVTGEKLWPNPHPMGFDGPVCAICQCPLAKRDAFKLDHVGPYFIHNV